MKIQDADMKAQTRQVLDKIKVLLEKLVNPAGGERMGVDPFLQPAVKGLVRDLDEAGQLRPLQARLFNEGLELVLVGEREFLI